MSNREKAVWAVVSILGAVIAILAIGAASNVAFSFGIRPGWPGDVMTWCAVALVVAAAAVAGIALAWVALQVIATAIDKGKDHLETPKKTYLPFLGIFVGICTNLLGMSLGTDKIVSTIWGAVIAVIAAAAGKLFADYPKIGLALYVAIIVLTAAIIANHTSPNELRQWLEDRDARDWALMIATAVLVIGTPVFVWRVELWRARAGEQRLSHLSNPRAVATRIRPKWVRFTRKRNRPV